MQKKRKSYWSVSEIGPSPLKVDADGDGRVGIWKAPLPGGTAELKIHKKFKQHSINIKNYTAHPHHLVHVPAKFRENTAMRFWVTVRKLNVTDGQTDRRTDGRTEGVAISPVPGPTAPAGDNNMDLTHFLPKISPN